MLKAPENQRAAHTDLREGHQARQWSLVSFRHEAFPENSERHKNGSPGEEASAKKRELKAQRMEEDDD